jgi:hypothetical protein
MGEIQRPTVCLVNHLHQFCLGSELVLGVLSHRKNREIQKRDQRMVKSTHPRVKRRSTTIQHITTRISRTARRQGIPHRPQAHAKVCSDKPFMPHRPVKSIADDLLWWDESLRSGRVKLSIPPPLPFADIQAFSDASSSVGIDIVISGRWRAWRLLPG